MFALGTLSFLPNPAELPSLPILERSSQTPAELLEQLGSSRAALTKSSPGLRFLGTLAVSNLARCSVQLPRGKGLESPATQTGDLCRAD